MKQVIIEYAGAALAILGATVVFALLGGVFMGGEGIGSVLGKILSYSIAEETQTEQSALEEFYTGTTLELEEKNVYLTANQMTLVSDCFVVKNQLAEEVEIQAKRLWDADWNERTAEISEDGRSVCISETGCFWLEVSALDSNQREHGWIVKVLVNER